jgi:hypothetical protein
MNPSKRFENALLVERVMLRSGMEHDTAPALEAYLKEHPDADRSKHTVKKPDKSRAKTEDQDKKKTPSKAEGGSKKKPISKRTQEVWAHTLGNNHLGGPVKEMAELIKSGKNPSKKLFEAARKKVNENMNPMNPFLAYHDQLPMQNTLNDIAKQFGFKVDEKYEKARNRPIDRGTDMW